MKRLCVLVFAVLTVSAAQAVIVGSDADTYLRDTTVRGAYAFMDVRGGSIDFAGYLRFDLSSVSYSTLEGAQLVLTVSGGASRNDTVVDSRFALYGLNNVAGNTAQNWDETVLMDTNPGQEWESSALAAAAVTNGWVTDLDGDVAGVTEIVPGVSDAGSKIIISGAAFEAFLQSRVDDGGLVTFILANDDGSDRGFGIATKENATADWQPQLILVPEPATMILLGLGSLLAVRRKRG